MDYKQKRMASIATSLKIIVTELLLVLILLLLSGCGTIQCGLVCINTPSGVKVQTTDEVEVEAQVDEVSPVVELNGSKIIKDQEDK